MLFSLSQTPLNVDTHVKVNAICHKQPSSSFFAFHSQNPLISSYPPFLKHFLCTKQLAMLIFLIIMMPQFQREIANICHFYTELSTSDNRFHFFSHFWNVIPICFSSLGFPRKWIFSGNPVVCNKMPPTLHLLSVEILVLEWEGGKKTLGSWEVNSNRIQVCSSMCTSVAMLLSSVFPRDEKKCYQKRQRINQKTKQHCTEGYWNIFSCRSERDKMQINNKKVALFFSVDNINRMEHSLCHKISYNIHRSASCALEWSRL